jgi:RimJ/RimL family protein N-acetyltransferase
LFVARNAKAGDILTCDIVRSVRPAHGLHPRNLPLILGRHAARDLTAASPLTWDAVGIAPEPKVSLRAASARDRDALLAWRNDPATRGMSLQQEAVSPADHERWFASSLDSRDRLLFIAEKDGAVGTIRLDLRQHGLAEVSLTVAPDHRKRGYAAEMIRAVEPHARDRQVRTLVAAIRPENEPSVRAFKSAGYYGFHELHGVLHCERRLGPYA